MLVPSLKAIATTTDIALSLDKPPVEPLQTESVLASACHDATDETTEAVVYTADTVCKSGLTRPSLWWLREQLGSQLGKKLVSNWIATPGAGRIPGQVVVIVNPQAWSLLDYFERYEFLHAFGLAARDFGYETTVQDSRGIDLASYSCEGGLAAGRQCQIQFRGFGSGSGFRGGS